ISILANILAAKQLSEKTGKGLSKREIINQQREFERETKCNKVFNMDRQDPNFPKEFAKFIKRYNNYCDKSGQPNRKVKPLNANPTLKEVEELSLNMGSGGDSGYTGNGNSFIVAGLESGEIVLPDLYGSAIQGAINHVGMYDSSKYYSLSSKCFFTANNDKNKNGLGYSYVGVGYESPNYYRDAFDQVYCAYVKNHDSDELNALNKAKSEANIGEKYSVLSLKSNTSKWYCSKVAWYGYKYGANVDIDCNGGLFVKPVDIYKDSDVVIWKHYE
ncbi:hypothetical protein, partial [Vallitalea maricola]|uniref:hypothetical protein n=1 Tax=Vallitalea maricola TaxID=3074433 RepID=UPI0030D86074